MGLDLYFDDRSIERLTSIQLPSSMTLSPGYLAAWLPLASNFNRAIGRAAKVLDFQSGQVGSTPTWHSQTGYRR